MQHFPLADLSRLLSLPMSAVAVRTEDEILGFMANAREQFPNLIHWDDETALGWLDDYPEDLGFTLFLRSSTEPRNITYCNVPWFRDNDYQILEYSQLILSEDLQESDRPLVLSWVFLKS